MANEKLSWKGVCVSLGLITDDIEIDKYLLEASTFAIRKVMRHSFVSILLECQSTNLLQL